MRLRLDEVVAATGGTLAPAAARSAQVVISGVSTDTRTLRAGDLFIPLRGPRTDGHHFIPEAFRRGAAASLASRPIPGDLAGPVIQVADGVRALADLARGYRARLDVRVVGVTGSVGKTTTVALCAAVLGVRRRVLRTPDEWNAELGVPLALLALEPEHQVAVIEMAMRAPGQIADLVALARPEVGVVTTIGESHLEFLGTIEAVARAKGELIDGLPQHGTAVLNADDARVRALAARSRAQVLTYGFASDADVRAEEAWFTPRGMRVRLAAPEPLEVDLPAWGRHNVRNALAAAAVARALGVDRDAIRDGLADWHPPKMRLEPVIAGDVLIINDAYNASPASMQAAFDVLAEVGRGRRLVAALGEMKELGTAAVRMHQDVGRSLSRLAVGLLVTVEPGADAIADGAEAAGIPRERIVRTRSVAEAADRLGALVRPGDVVLVKGSRALRMERLVDALRVAVRS